MKINRGDIYQIKLYLEPEKISSKETYLLDIIPDEARQHILHVK